MAERSVWESILSPGKWLVACPDCHKTYARNSKDEADKFAEQHICKTSQIKERLKRVVGQQPLMGG